MQIEILYILLKNPIWEWNRKASESETERVRDIESKTEIEKEKVRESV